jgi:isoleucyl-tRNA synthetase
VADKIEQNGIEAWFESDIEDFLGVDAKDYERKLARIETSHDAGLNLQDTNLLHPPNLLGFLKQ